MRKLTAVAILIVMLVAILAQKTSQAAWGPEWSIELKNTMMGYPRQEYYGPHLSTVTMHDFIMQGKYVVINPVADRNIEVWIFAYARATDRARYELEGSSSVGIIGLGFSPKAYIGFEAGIGTNTTSGDAWRGRGVLWLKKSNKTERESPCSFRAEVEMGGVDGWYWQIRVRKNVGWIGLGLITESNIGFGAGIGPRIDLPIPYTPISLYFSALLRDKDKSEINRFLKKDFFAQVGAYVDFK